VTRILSEPEYRAAIEASRSRCVALLPKAERAVELQLDEGDGDLGLRLLEKSGVLRGEDHAARFALQSNTTLQLAIQMLPRQGPQTPQGDAGNEKVESPEI